MYEQRSECMYFHSHLFILYTLRIVSKSTCVYIIKTHIYIYLYTHVFVYSFVYLHVQKFKGMPAARGVACWRVRFRG